LFVAIGDDPHEDTAYDRTDDLAAAKVRCDGWCLRALPQYPSTSWGMDAELSENLCDGSPIHFQALPPYPDNDNGYDVRILAIDLHRDRPGAGK
jgi:hypothetical protein